MTIKKALPDNVDEFFKGTSVFFSPSSTEGKIDEDVKPIPSKEKATNGESKKGSNLESSSRPVNPNQVSINKIVPSTKSNERTGKPNGHAERSSIILELAGEIKEAEQRRTERYSFEIYIDQIGTIEDLQYKYKKRTGKRLSSSRIIREALDEYLKKAEKTL